MAAVSVALPPQDMTDTTLEAKPQVTHKVCCESVTNLWVISSYLPALLLYSRAGAQLAPCALDRTRGPGTVLSCSMHRLEP